jgi:hypothetical protein
VVESTSFLKKRSKKLLIAVADLFPIEAIKIMRADFSVIERLSATKRKSNFPRSANCAWWA